MKPIAAQIASSAATNRMSAPSGVRPSQQRLVPIVILIGVAILAGGGGVAYGFANLLVQLTALAILAFNRPVIAYFINEAPRSLRVCIGLSVALPILQLVPLPPTVWQSLPGRELISESLAAAGISAGWRPMSVDPMRTLVATLSLLVPLSIIALGWFLSREHLVKVGWAIVAVGIVGFLWGVPQVISQGQLAVPYPENPMPGVLFASFANRNSTGLFFVACLTLVVLLQAPPRWPATPLIRWLCSALFLLAIFLTQSRTAMVLVAIPIALATLQWAAVRSKNGRLSQDQKPATGRLALALLSAAIFAGGAIFAVNISDNRISTALERFDQGSGSRLTIWEDAGYSAKRFSPLGSGMGTFDEVFQIDESLEHLSQRTAGRAHNDYLELLIEAGWPGLGVLGCWLLLIIWWSWRARHSTQRWQAWAGAGILFAITLQSITDYPLRNLSMMTIAACALLFLGRFGTDKMDAADES